MKPLRSFFLTAVVIAGALGLARAEVQVGDQFPVLTALEFGGGALPATTGKVVVVDFWASWCAPCKASFPVYARLHADYAARDVVVIAVSVDEKEAPFAAFVKKYAPPFVTVRDKAQQLVAQVKVPAMPTAYVLDRQGRVRFVHRGFHGAESDRELRRQLDTLLAEKASSS